MNRLLSVGVALALTNAPNFCAARDIDQVEGEIVGTITRGGKPIAGLKILSCRDWGGSTKAPCLASIQVTTNRQGRFSFTKFTGFRPKTAVRCSNESPCVIGDPGWNYWFKVVDGNETRLFWNGGLGYGRLFARVECDLGSSKNIGHEELDCMVSEVPLDPVQK